MLTFITSIFKSKTWAEGRRQKVGCSDICVLHQFVRSFYSTGQSCAHLYLMVPCLLEPRRMSPILFQRHPFQRTSISSRNHHLHKNKTKSDQQCSESLWIWLTFSKPIHITLNKWQANDAIECSHLIKMMSFIITNICQNQKFLQDFKIRISQIQQKRKGMGEGGGGGEWQLSPSHTPVPRNPTKTWEAGGHIPVPHMRRVWSWGLMKQMVEILLCRWLPLDKVLVRVPFSQSHILKLSPPCSHFSHFIFFYADDQGNYGAKTLTNTFKQGAGAGAILPVPYIEIVSSHFSHFLFFSSPIYWNCHHHVHTSVTFYFSMPMIRETMVQKKTDRHIQTRCWCEPSPMYWNCHHQVHPSLHNF